MHLNNYYKITEKVILTGKLSIVIVYSKPHKKQNKLYMIQLILILTLIWLLIGALTFSFASVNKTVIMTHWTVIKCTLLGALSLFILVTNYLRDQELEREKYRHNQNIKL